MALFISYDNTEFFKINKVLNWKSFSKQSVFFLLFDDTTNNNILLVFYFVSSFLYMF